MTQKDYKSSTRRALQTSMLLWDSIILRTDTQQRETEERNCFKQGIHIHPEDFTESMKVPAIIGPAISGYLFDEG
jgi:hypothetical protein